MQVLDFDVDTQIWKNMDYLNFCWSVVDKLLFGVLMNFLGFQSSGCENPTLLTLISLIIDCQVTKIWYIVKNLKVSHSLFILHKTIAKLDVFLKFDINYQASV